MLPRSVYRSVFFNVTMPDFPLIPKMIQKLVLGIYQKKLVSYDFGKLEFIWSVTLSFSERLSHSRISLQEPSTHVF